MCEAAAVLGKNRKTLQRWRARRGAPFDSDGSVDLEELRSWAAEEGLLDRPAHRPPEIDKLTSEIRPQAPATPPPAPAASRQTPKPPQSIPSALEELSVPDREALEALVAGDRGALIDLAAKIDPFLLKRLAAMGRTRRELAEAERRELENRQKRGELVAIEEMRRFWGGQIQTVKGHFQSLPGKLAPRLVEKTYDQIYQVIDEELHALLEVFAVEVPA